MTTTPVHDLLRSLGIKLRNRGDAYARSLPLTYPQSRAIGYIDDVEEHAHRGVIQRELAEISGTSAASVSSLIDGLEKAGYVERRPSPGDARRKEIHLLPKGKGLTRGFDHMMEQTEEQLLSPLSATERSTLIDLLTRIDSHLDSAADPTTARHGHHDH
ncbi:MAG TPA: MarR family transcriptional regulator [Pseudolysinimonas sp.]|nr:MarR family transcriptional regulator [Pseudolysinimonas sp.]